MEQLVERARIDAADRFLFGNQALSRHFDRDAQRRLGGALAAARLQHPQRPAFDGEFDILHVAVMGFERVEDAAQFPEGLGHRLFHRQRLGPRLFARDLRQILRGADARDDVLALRVDQPFAVPGALAGRGIARERHAGRRGVAHIAEHHRLHIDRGAPFAGDRVQAAIDFRTVAFPAGEDGADRAPQLVLRFLRKGCAGLALDDRLIFLDQRLPVFSRHLRIEEKAPVFLGDFQCFFELGMVEAHDDVGVHLDEAAIAVPRETRVARGFGKPRDGRIVEPEVEDGVHHPRHRHARARPDRNEQRVRRVAEPLAGDPLDMRDAAFDVGGQPVGKCFAIGVIGGADVGGDRKARRDRQADRRHFGKVRSLAAQQFLRTLGRRGRAAEQMHHLRHVLLLLPRGGGRGWIGMQSRLVDSVLLRSL